MRIRLTAVKSLAGGELTVFGSGSGALVGEFGRPPVLVFAFGRLDLLVGCDQLGPVLEAVVQVLADFALL